ATFFVVAALYAIMRAGETGRWTGFALAGILLGLAGASKLNMLLASALVPCAAMIFWFQHERARHPGGARWRSLIPPGSRTLIAALFTIAIFRLAQPIAFQSGYLWD